MKFNLLIVSMNKKASLFLKDSLIDVFNKQLEINSYSYVEDTPNILNLLVNNNTKLIIATGRTSYKLIKSQFQNKEIILATRDLGEPEFFDKVFMIPTSEKVLVVNETKIGALETITSLKNLGIVDLIYIPYWENCNINVSGLNYAISPGMLYYCPENVKIKIDIGMRNLSIVTFLKILNVYNLDYSYMNKYIERLKKILITTYHKLSKSFVVEKNLRKSLSIIVDEIEDGIISISSENIIININKTAKNLICINAEKILNKNIFTFFNIYTDIDLSHDVFEFNGIIKINNLEVFMEYIPLENNALKANNYFTGFFKLKDIKKIQNDEEKVRKIINKKKKLNLTKYSFNNILTKNKIMNDLINESKIFSKTNSTILITGESGTGKELIAQSIHHHSYRSSEPFIAMNFSAIPETLIESELFGYEKGAFTGAKSTGKKGLFETAHEGTIFLDEIGDASLSVQSRLLRVLEEKEVMRLGDNKTIPVNVRIVTATNKNLLTLIKKGLFREDLYHRINVFKLHLPPLRARPEDIIYLSNNFLKINNTNKILSNEVITLFLEYNWPGNIRELKHVIEYVSIKSKSKEILVKDLPHDMLNYKNCQRDSNIKYEEIYFFLRSSYSVNIIYHILSTLSLFSEKNKHKGLGRLKIIEVLKQYDIQLTESEIKSIIKDLSSLDLVNIGTTKQGTRLSNKGTEFLIFLKERKY